VDGTVPSTGVFLILFSGLPTQTGRWPEAGPQADVNRTPVDGRPPAVNEQTRERAPNPMTTIADPPDRVLDSSDLLSVDAGDPPTFASLGVDPALVKALAAEGITTTFAIQAMTVADALAGRDVCGKAKTGSGKTLAFGIPLLQRTMAARSTEPGRPRALVLVPTRELAVQVSEVLEPLAKEAGPPPSTGVPTSSAR
jgi:ATP-dependent helicase YprA (DUF1998 family)